MAVAAAIVLAGAGAWTQGTTFDEPVHLGWSDRLLTGRGAKRGTHVSVTPATVPNAAARRMAIAAGVQDEHWVRFITRLPALGWLIGLLLATHALVRRALGPTAAALTCIGLALEPTLIAHSSLVGTDVPFACAYVVAFLSLLRFVEQPTFARGMLAGAAIGLAFATKAAAVLLVFAIASLPFWPWTRDSTRVRKLARTVWLAPLTACVVLCAAYLFVDIGVVAGEHDWSFAPFAWVASRAPWLPLPLPRALLIGLDGVLAQEGSQPWRVVLLGASHPGGAPHYFLVAWALKTPLAWIALTLLGFVSALRRDGARHRAWRACALLAMALLLYLSFGLRRQLGFRMALVVLPFAYSLAAAGLADSFATRRARMWGLAAFAFTLFEHVLYFGNPLSFTNVAVLPKKHVYRLIADSNLDWGQHRDRIAQWAAQDGVSLERVEPVHILPGPNVYPVNAVAGVWGSWDDFAWERKNLAPTRHYGHTYLRFDVDDATFTRCLRETRAIVPNAHGARLCADAPAPARAVSDAAVVEGPRGSGGAENNWIVCLDALQPAIIGLRSERVAWLGAITADGRCPALEVKRDRELWFAADAGVHALCAFGAERPALRWQMRSGAATYRSVPGRSRPAAAPIAPAP